MAGVAVGVLPCLTADQVRASLQTVSRTRPRVGVLRNSTEERAQIAVLQMASKRGEFLGSGSAGV